MYCYFVVQCKVLSDSSWPHGLQHARSPCPSPSPTVYPDSCPLSQGCYSTISSSVILFSCCQPFPASGSFPVCRLFTLGNQSIGVSASASILPVNTQGWFPLCIVFGNIYIYICMYICPVFLLLLGVFCCLQDLTSSLLSWSPLPFFPLSISHCQIYSIFHLFTVCPCLVECTRQKGMVCVGGWFVHATVILNI